MRFSIILAGAVSVRHRPLRESWRKKWCVHNRSNFDTSFQTHINKKIEIGARSMKSLRTKPYNFGKIASDYLKSLVNRLAGMLVYPQFQYDSPWGSATASAAGMS
jgi:hypothetical protein